MCTQAEGLSQTKGCTQALGRTQAVGHTQAVRRAESVWCIQAGAYSSEEKAGRRPAFDE